jgi:GNAT superfamily N-acetyltransferase
MSSSLFTVETHAAGDKRESDVCDYEEHGEVLFRKFQPNGDDEQQMRELVFENAFLGQPFDEICPCKDWFGDVVLSPYIKHEPENIHVAIDKPSGRLIGYLTGSLGGQEFEKTQHNWVRKKVASLAVTLSMPWSLFDHTSRSFATHVIFKGENERPSHPQSGVHWHFQVDKDFRARGVGAKLLQRFTKNAKQTTNSGIIWAEVMAYPDKPRSYFEDRGWSIHDAKPTTIFGEHVDFPVHTLCVTKPLSSFQALADAA